MTRVEDALRKLRSRGATTSTTRDSGKRGHSANSSAVPVATKKKVTIDGPKHHVSQSALTAAGLLAPLDLAIPVADEFRRVKRPLIQNATRKDWLGSGPANVIMIASALPAAGKTFCAVNLAVSISLERELNVLLVDADVAKPHISREFGLGGEPGLIDLLVDEGCKIQDMLVRTDVNDIQVLPAGRRHEQATELLASDRMSAIVQELASQYPDRIIILDSPPLLITSEAQALASQVGQIALVIEAGKTTQQTIAHAIDTLDEEKAINLVLNKRSHWGRGRYYGDGGYYGYGYPAA